MCYQCGQSKWNGSWKLGEPSSMAAGVSSAAGWPMMGAELGLGLKGAKSRVLWDLHPALFSAGLWAFLALGYLLRDPLGRPTLLGRYCNEMSVSVLTKDNE